MLFQLLARPSYKIHFLSMGKSVPEINVFVECP